MAERMSKLRERGVAAVELLLITPLVFLIGYAMSNFVLAIALQGKLQNCVQAGVQYAAFSRAQALDDAGISAAVESAANSEFSVSVMLDRYCACLDATTGTLNIVDCDSGLCSGREPPPQRFIALEATAPYRFKWQIPGLPTVWTLKSRLDLRTF